MALNQRAPLPPVGSVDLPTLYAAVRQVASRATAPGIDGLRPEGLGADASARWATARRLARRLCKGEVWPFRCIGPDKCPYPPVLDRVVGGYLNATELSGLGHSTPDVEDICTGIRDLHRACPDAVVLRLDIANCFGSIRDGTVYDFIEGKVSAFAEAWIRETRRIDGPNYRGLPRGRPESAALANGLFTGFDAWARDSSLSYARWVDDLLLVLTPEIEPSVDLLETVEAHLPAGFLLSDKPEKRVAVEIGGGVPLSRLSVSRRGVPASSREAPTHCLNGSMDSRTRAPKEGSRPMPTFFAAG